MAKVYVEFDIADQTLCTHIPTSTIRAGTQGTYFAKFSFDAAWADLANIRAVFFRDKLCKAMDLVKEDDSFVCEIHPAVIAEPGRFSLGLFAGKQQITNLEFVPVLPSFKNELFQNADVLDWFATVDQYIAEKQPLVLSGTLNAAESRMTLSSDATAENVQEAYEIGRNITLKLTLTDEGLTDVCLHIPLVTVNAYFYFFSAIVALDASGTLFAVNCPIGRASLLHYGVTFKKITTENI